MSHFPGIEQEIKENREEDTKNYLYAALEFYQEELQAVADEEEKKNRNLFIAATNLNPERFIDNMPNNNDESINEFDETKTDSERKCKPFEYFLSMVSVSVENSVKSVVACIKSKTISVSGFSEYKDKLLKAEVKMEEPDIKPPSGDSSNSVINLDGNICIKTQQ